MQGGAKPVLCCEIMAEAIVRPLISNGIETSDKQTDKKVCTKKSDILEIANKPCVDLGVSRIFILILINVVFLKQIYGSF